MYLTERARLPPNKDKYLLCILFWVIKHLPSLLRLFNLYARDFSFLRMKAKDREESRRSGEDIPVSDIFYVSLIQ